MYYFLASCFLLLLWIQHALPLNVLVSTPHGGPNTWNVTATQYLNASHFYLVMQPDCNLVTYNGSTPFLTTELHGVPVEAPNCYATLQADGNLVIYSSSNTLVWSSDTDSRGYKGNSTYKYLLLGRDGSVSMFDQDGTQINPKPFKRVDHPVPVSSPFAPELAWKPTWPLDGFPYMPAEYFLTQGSKLQTVNALVRRFILLLGHDCRLQSRELWMENDTAKRVVWEAPEGGVVSGNCELRLQLDGRLEVRDNVSGVVYWNSSVSGDESVTWVVKLDRDDGHVSVSDILDPTNVLWSSSSAAEENGPTAVLWPMVVGVVGGVLFLVLATLGPFWYFYLRPRFLNYSAEKVVKRRLQSVGRRAQALSEAKIKRATNSFGCRIGYGGFGDVFYGKLEDGQEIAAKVLTAGSHQSKEEFYNEIELLSVVHHKHLVSLLGYSFTRKHQVLVYEYMGGGDLRRRLQGDGAATNPLTWRQRTSIALQVAEGLEYLHDKCSPAIIHRDVKSNNILLTTDLLVAKVADFGLSKLRREDEAHATHITTAVKGTPGYLDPEYHDTGMLTEKSDVYAFGIVLMEILTGQHHMSIAEGVSEAWKSGQFDDLADPNLRGDFDRHEFVSMVALSLWCVNKRNLGRPHMREVVQKQRQVGFSTSLGSSKQQPDAHVVRFGIESAHSGSELLSDVGFGEFPSSGTSGR